MAITSAPESGVGPVTWAARPSMRIFAPMRCSSATCMYRFSKIDSVITLTPRPMVIIAMYCACMSVGKPGWAAS